MQINATMQYLARSVPLAKRPGGQEARGPRLPWWDR
jgi:hypothetical protein